MKEKHVQRAILDWLAAERIWHIRLNTGAFSGVHNGKRRFVKFGVRGMADIIAFPQSRIILPPGTYEMRMHDRILKSLMVNSGTELDSFFPFPVWIEVKTVDGVWSQDQQLFANAVRERGMKYILARSLDDVIAFLK